MNRLKYMAKRLLPLCVAVVLCASGLVGGVRTAWAANINSTTINVLVKLEQNNIAPSDAADKEFPIGLYETSESAPITLTTPIVKIAADGHTTTNVLSANATIKDDGTEYLFKVKDTGGASFPTGYGIVGMEVSGVTASTTTWQFNGTDTLTLMMGELYARKGNNGTVETGDGSGSTSLSIDVIITVAYIAPTLRVNNTGGGTVTVKQGDDYSSSTNATLLPSNPYLSNTPTYFPVAGKNIYFTEATAGYSITGATASVVGATNPVLALNNSIVTLSGSSIANKCQYTVDITHSAVNATNDIKIKYTLTPSSNDPGIFDVRSGTSYANYILQDKSILPGAEHSILGSGVQLPNGNYRVYIKINNDKYRLTQALVNGSVVSHYTTNDGLYYYVDVALNGSAATVEFKGRPIESGANKSIKLKASVSNASNDTTKFPFYVRFENNDQMALENVLVPANDGNGVSIDSLSNIKYRVGVRVPSGYTLENIKIDGSTQSYTTDGDWRYLTVDVSSSSKEVVATFKREAYMGIRIRKVISNNANNTNTAFTFHIKDKDGKSLSRDNLSITGNTSYVEYKLDAGEYRVYEVSKSGYALSGVTANGSGLNVNTDGNDKYVLVTLSESNQNIEVVFNNTQDNVTSGLTIIPNGYKAKPGDAVNYTISGFGNQSGQVVYNYIFDIQIPQGMVFHQLTLPVFRNSSFGYAPAKGVTGMLSSAYMKLATNYYYGLGYDLKYNTNLNGNFMLMRGNLNSYSSYVVDSPLSLGYNEQIRTLRIEIPSVPAGFGVGDVITLNCIVANDAPSSMNTTGNVTYRLPNNTVVSFASDAAPSGPVLLSTDSGGSGGGGTVDIVATGEETPYVLYTVSALLALTGIAMFIVARRLGRRARGK